MLSATALVDVGFSGSLVYGSTDGNIQHLHSSSVELIMLGQCNTEYHTRGRKHYPLDHEKHN